MLFFWKERHYVFGPCFFFSSKQKKVKKSKADELQIWSSRKRIKSKKNFPHIWLFSNAAKQTNLLLIHTDALIAFFENKTTFLSQHMSFASCTLFSRFPKSITVVIQ